MTGARRWRLRGYTSTDKKDKPVADEVLPSDERLNTAMARLEGDKRIKRITVASA